MQCNAIGCPDHSTPLAACAFDGLACHYDNGLTTDYCIDGHWLECGDALGVGCANPAPQGSTCCPNYYFGPCACVGGRACRCVALRVQCDQCD